MVLLSCCWDLIYPERITVVPTFSDISLLRGRGARWSGYPGTEVGDVDVGGGGGGGAGVEEVR